MKKLTCYGMIIGIIMAIYSFIKSYGNINNFINPYFYMFFIGCLILLISIWFYPESPAKLSATGKQDKQEGRVFTPPSSPPANINRYHA